MRRSIGSRLVGWTIVFVIAVCLLSGFSSAQERSEQGHSIGKVSVHGNLIVMELDDAVLGKANLFDLSGRTLRFIPQGSQYRIESGTLQWDPEFGPELKGAQVALHQFAFPFSGKRWTSFSVGRTGSIAFEGKSDSRGDSPESGDGGVSIGRFDPLSEAASELVASAPAICVFFKPRMSGSHYLKELPDRAVITWDVTEPYGNIQDFTWFKTTNQFQAVLHRDGTIEMSYRELAAKDAIVGIYPALTGEERVLATLRSAAHGESAGHLDIQSVRLAVADAAVLKVTFDLRGPALAVGDPALKGVAYRLFFDPPQPGSGENHEHAVAWTVRGVSWGQHPSRYVAFGPGLLRKVEVSGNTISVIGVLPPTMRGLDEALVSAESAGPGDDDKPVVQVPARRVRLSGIHSPEVDFSTLSSKDGPFEVAYESFHHLSLPRSEDLSCTVINGLGDHFDFLAYYSDFRVDNQEAGTPSDGPVGGNVTGIGAPQHDLEQYCTKGRFQWEYVQPVYVGSNQMQKYPPDGAPAGSDHDITFYLHQLAESTPEHKLRSYNYAMSQIGHEMGHRWSAFVSAKVNDETIPLGPVHWDGGLQAPVAFPYQLPTEASAMGGGVWQDNLDGTYTQLEDNYYVPASGYSYLDLYLMGLISAAEVPDFFILRDLAPAGSDANGHPIFKARRTKVSIQDVIAAEGPRLPDVDHSQRNFNTGIVVVVEHGKSPSRELLQRADAIREHWIDYWGITTGHRATMTTNPQ